MGRRRIVFRHEIARRIDVASRLKHGTTLVVGWAVATRKREGHTVLHRTPTVILGIALVPHRVAPPEVVAIFFRFRRAHVALRPVGGVLPLLNAFVEFLGQQSIRNSRLIFVHQPKLYNKHLIDVNSIRQFGAFTLGNLA